MVKCGSDSPAEQFNVMLTVSPAGTVKDVGVPMKVFVPSPAVKLKQSELMELMVDPLALMVISSFSMALPKLTSLVPVFVTAISNWHPSEVVLAFVIV